MSCRWVRTPKRVRPGGWPCPPSAHPVRRTGEVAARKGFGRRVWRRTRTGRIVRTGSADVSTRYIGPIHRTWPEGGRGMLEFAILGLLHESSMHGYELRKQLTATIGAFRAAVSYGSLYPTLRRLREAGWITEDAPDA